MPKKQSKPVVEYVTPQYDRPPIRVVNVAPYYEPLVDPITDELIVKFQRCIQRDILARAGKTLVLTADWIQYCDKRFTGSELAAISAERVTAEDELRGRIAKLMPVSHEPLP